MASDDSSTMGSLGDVEFRSRDGLRLRGTLVTPSSFDGSAVVLVHGGGATRDEGGFFPVSPQNSPGRFGVAAVRRPRPRGQLEGARIANVAEQLG